MVKLQLDDQSIASHVELIANAVRPCHMAVYLPHAPVIPENFGQASGNEKYLGLVASNGNHWRKILIIACKIMAAEHWRAYRDEHLFSGEVQFLFPNPANHTGALQQANCAAKWHLIAGKASWSKFGLTAENITANIPPATDIDGPLEKAPNDSLRCIDQHYPCYQRQHTLYTPYFDYRQLPNALAMKLHQIILPEL